MVHCVLTHKKYCTIFLSPICVCIFKARNTAFAQFSSIIYDKSTSKTHSHGETRHAVRQVISGLETKQVRRVRTTGNSTRHGKPVH